MSKHTRTARIESVDENGVFRATLATEGEASDGDILSIKGGKIPKRMPMLNGHYNSATEQLGSITDAVFALINTGARVCVCGQISQYNLKRPQRAPRCLIQLLVKQARAEGFLVMQFADRFEMGRRQMARWIEEGRLRYRERIVDGIENAPRAFIGMLEGENIGKQLVRVAEQ